MNIDFNATPSIDSSGVKRWTFDLGAGNVLDVFESKGNRQFDPSAVFRLSLFHCNGTRVAHSFARDKINALQLARYIERDVARGEHDPAWQIVARATHERGVRQALALATLGKRGLYLSPEHRQQARLSYAAA